MSISKLNSKCEKCSYKDNCDNKRMVACGILELPPALTQSENQPAPQNISMPITREHTPIIINMGEYGNVETSMEKLQKQLKRDIYNCIHDRCNF